MLRISRYAYLQTLTAIFSKRLLSHKQLSYLLKLPIDKILPALGHKGLDNIIQHLTQAQLKLLPAGNMDNLFLSVLLDDAQSIIRSLSGVERDFFIYWIRRFELQNIKTILRGKSLQREQEQIVAELTPLGPFSVLPIDELLHADNIPEILLQLEKTPFAAIARYGSKNFEKKQDVFTIETAINHQYFTGLQKQLRLLSEEDQAILRPLLGRIIDQTNLIWLLRYRLSYQLSPSHTYFLLVPGGLYLSSKRLVQLSKIKKWQQLCELLPEKMKAQITGCASIHHIELSLEQDIINYASRMLKTNTFTLSHAFIYLVVREKQLSQLHALLKGKLLHLADKEIAFATGECL